MKIPAEWLTQRADNAPAASHRKLPETTALRIRMAWQKLKRKAEDGDEIWHFVNPSNTWKKLGKYTGYAIVRGGKIVESVVVTEG